MDNQYFQIWEIDGIANAKYDVENIAWTSKGLVATIIPDRVDANTSRHKFLLVWEPSAVISYHVTDETYRGDCWGVDFESNGRFYTATVSDYIANLRQKSPLFPDSIIHFLIVGTDAIVDVLAKEYPVVDVIK